MNNHSESIKELTAALAKAQGGMKAAVFNKTNPHFRSKYADFSSCMEACRIPLSENGLAVVQYCDTINEKLYLITHLMHVSGEWIKSSFPLITAKMDSQGIGSAMTYAKRYSLCGMIGIVADEDTGDDDGEASVGRGECKAALHKVSEDQIKILIEIWKGLLKENKDKLALHMKKSSLNDFKSIPSQMFQEILKFVTDLRNTQQEEPI